MTLLDAGLVLAAAAAGWAGYRRGVVAALLALVGLLAGALTGIVLAAPLVGSARSAVLRIGVLLGLLVGFALVMHIVGAVAGTKLRTRLGVRGRRLDARGGAVFGACTMLVVAWMGASTLSTETASSRRVADSEVLRLFDAAMPARGDVVLVALERMLNRGGPTPLFSLFADEGLVDVPAPDPADALTPGVQQAAGSVVRVQGYAPGCGVLVTGSGFVFAPEHVLTNAHVVAGVARSVVQTPRGRGHSAVVVLFDPERDVAVLYVPGLRAEPLPLSSEGAAKQGMAVAGFPGGGDYQASAARIRVPLIASGPDIYGSRTVARRIYSLYGSVSPGNSGGPLLTPSGAVAGMVYGATQAKSNVGWALTTAEFNSDAADGATATEPVSTGSTCP